MSTIKPSEKAVSFLDLGSLSKERLYLWGCSNKGKPAVKLVKSVLGSQTTTVNIERRRFWIWETEKWQVWASAHQGVYLKLIRPPTDQKGAWAALDDSWAEEFINDFLDTWAHCKYVDTALNS